MLQRVLELGASVGHDSINICPEVNREKDTGEDQGLESGVLTTLPVKDRLLACIYFTCTNELRYDIV